MTKQFIPLPKMKDYIPLVGVLAGCIGICIMYDLINIKEIKNKANKYKKIVKNKTKSYFNSFKAL